MILKEYINQIVNDQPINYSRILQKNSEIVDLISPIMVQYKVDFKTALYCYVNNTSPLCHYGVAKPLRSFAKGLAYCGRKGKCKCLNEDQPKKTSSAYDKKSIEQIEKSNKKRKQTKQEIYGDPNFNNKEKRKQTNIIKYGHEYPGQVQKVKDKAIATSLKRHGISHYTNRNQAKKTMVDRYGKEYSGQVPKFCEKMKRTTHERYGVSNFQKLHIPKEILEILDNLTEFRSFITGKTRPEIIYELEVDSTTIDNRIKRYDASSLLRPSDRSFLEERVNRVLTNLNISFIQNTKTLISPLEVDFYLPDFNAAIEINGNYWHSEIGGKKDKKYHYRKWMACRELGIDLYSWFEDELIDNFHIIESKIKYITKQPIRIIGARKCQLSYITGKEEKIFLNQYHIQGRQGGRDKVIGAIYDDKIVAIFSWLKRKQYLEITRYACDMNASYPGLFSKMMKRMTQDLDYTGPIVSFSNNGHSNGGVYKASGFQIDKIIGGAYWYTKDYRYRENRQGYMKAKIAKKFNIDMSCRTEWQAMRELGYDRIWDSGKIKWIKNV